MTGVCRLGHVRARFGGWFKLHVEISICGRLAEEEAEAGNNCHSPRRLSARTLRVCAHVDRLIINLAKWRE